MGLIGFLLGSVLGSFCLVLADRSLTEQSFWGRSYCTYCKKKLRWYDLFPILSFVFLQGRCRYCKKPLKIDYLVIEVIIGLLVGFLFTQYFNNLSLDTILTWDYFRLSIFIFDLIIRIFFIVILAVLFVTDLRRMFIPDRIILPSILIGLVATLLLTISKIGYLYYSLANTSVGKLLLWPNSDYFGRHVLIITQPFLYSLLMAILIGGFFLSLIIITKGKGMGGGDVKLGAFIGLMLGFPHSLLAIITGFILGAVFSIGLIIAGKKHFGQSIPFGPFLVLGSLIALFWGKEIINWYLKLGY